MKPTVLSCLLLMAALYPASLFAQAEAETYKIMGISVEGNKSSTSQHVIELSGLHQGGTFTVPGEEIARASERLWSQEIFSDVQIIVDKKLRQSDGTDGVFLVIRVTEFPRLGKIEILNNDHVKKSDIEKQIAMTRFEFLRPWEIAAMERKVRALYRKEGYEFATVTIVPQASDDTLGLTDLIVRINEGVEVTVRHIDFVGNTSVSSSDLRGAMEDTHEKRWYKIFTSGSFDKKKFQADKKRIVDYYKSRGYRDAEILPNDSIWVTGDGDLNILMHVSEGPQYHIRNIAVSGNKVFADQEVIDRIGFSKGDVYDIPRFEFNLRGPSPDFTDVGSLYYDRGYVVNFQKDETVTPGDSVDITIKILEGKQHFFRYVDLEGNTKTKDYVMRRELFTRPGEAFSRSAIIRSIRQLAQLNYFNQEKIQPDVRMRPDATDVDVVYKVEERSSDTFNASIGYGGTLGITGSVGLSFNNFDLRDPLHGGGGQLLNLTAEIGSQAYRTLSLSFTEPWAFQTPTTLGFTVYNSHSSYIYTVDRTGASLSAGRRFRWPDDYFRGDWTLAGQKSNIQNGGGIYVPGRHDEVSIQQVLSRRSTDNPVFPTTGSEFSLLTRIAYLPITSVSPNEPSNYFKTAFGMKFYTPLLSIAGQNKLVVVTSADIAQLGGIGANPYVPPTERFTMGGSGLASVNYTLPLRGYDDASIGVERLSGTGFASGGLAYARYAAEVRFIVSLEPIPIYFLSFLEAGNVWTDLSHADLFTLKRSAGVGARVQVPAVGLIGIDFGYGFDSPGNFGGASGWKTHFQFGRGF